MKNSDTLFLLKDVDDRQGSDYLGIFTDIREAKWYCQLYLQQICGEEDVLKWKKSTREGVFTARSKYQHYKIFTLTRKQLVCDLNAWINVKS